MALSASPAALPQQPWAVRARWVLPVAGPPIAGGHVLVRGSRIESLGAGTPPADALDLGDCVLLPGLVNAHTHLEFSLLQAPLGAPGQSLPDWIRQVVAWRHAGSTDAAAAVRSALAESLAGGATLIGEIATAGWPLGAPAPLDATVFFEHIGLSDERTAACRAAAARQTALPDDEQIAFGLSPHATYTIAPDLLAALVGLAAARDRPVAMHVAECAEEIELLQCGTGPMRKMLESLGAWNPAAFATPRSVQDVLKELVRAPRALIVHGNYLAAADIDLLAQHPDRMTLIHCPRTHARFGHPPFPLAELLSRGVSIALGTDSRASNPDLNMLDELRAAAARYPDVAPETLLALATRAGASALGRQSTHGTLEPGKLASMVAVPIAPQARDPYAALVESTGPPRAVWYRGRLNDGPLRTGEA